MVLWLQHPPAVLQDQKVLVLRHHQGFLMVLLDLCLQEDLLVQVDQSDLNLLAGQCFLCHQNHQLLLLDQEAQFGQQVLAIR